MKQIFLTTVLKVFMDDMCFHDEYTSYTNIYIYILYSFPGHPSLPNKKTTNTPCSYCSSFCSLFPFPSSPPPSPFLFLLIFLLLLSPIFSSRYPFPSSPFPPSPSSSFSFPSSPSFPPSLLSSLSPSLAHLAHVEEVEDVQRDADHGVAHGGDLAPLAAGHDVAEADHGEDREAEHERAGERPALLGASGVVAHLDGLHDAVLPVRWARPGGSGLDLDVPSGMQ